MLKDNKAKEPLQVFAVFWNRSVHYFLYLRLVGTEMSLFAKKGDLLCMKLTFINLHEQLVL